MAAKHVSITLTDRKYAATVDGGPSFFVGRKVSYEGNWGLMNIVTLPDDVYSPDSYRTKYGFWADFLHPIVQCESGGAFQCLNTYDRARFTFGFLQYAAHVPDGDFVRFFRTLLVTMPAADYFPELVVHDNVICKESQTGFTPLETPESTQPLQDFLNPSLNEVEEAEVIQSAKFVHWSLNEAEHRELQVQCGVDHMKKAMQQYAKTYSLDGSLDKICLVIADIHHQGRGKKIEVFDALDTGGDTDKAYTNLLEIGKVFYPDRIETLRSTIDAMVNDGTLGQRKYDATISDFVPLIASPDAGQHNNNDSRRLRRSTRTRAGTLTKRSESKR
jgi:hypothetical protein